MVRNYFVNINIFCVKETTTQFIRNSGFLSKLQVAELCKHMASDKTEQLLDITRQRLNNQIFHTLHTIYVDYLDRHLYHFFCYLLSQRFSYSMGGHRVLGYDSDKRTSTVNYHFAKPFSLFI